VVEEIYKKKNERSKGLILVCIVLQFLFVTERERKKIKDKR